MGRNSFGAVRKLPSGRYQASYIGNDGRRHPALSTFSHREDAYAWLSAERRHLEEGSAWISPAERAARKTPTSRAEDDAVAPTVSEWLAQCIKERETDHLSRQLRTTTGHWLA